MSRFRLIMMSLLAALAVSALSAGSALGADPALKETEECLNNVANVTTLCIVNGGHLWEQDQAGEWAFDGVIDTGTVSILTVLAGPIILCTEASSTFKGDTTAAETLSLELLNIVITFATCLVTNTATTEKECTVGPITAKAKGTVEVEGNDVNFEQNAGEAFALVTIKGAGCTLAVKEAEVTGTQLCTFNSVAELNADSATHLLICNQATETLEFAGKKAEFKLEESVLLEKGNEWSLQKS